MTHAELEKKWQVWSEGFRATGESAQAKFHGEFEGETFQEACDKWAKTAEPQYYDRDRLTYWGCGLFDNEADARKRDG